MQKTTIILNKTNHIVKLQSKSSKLEADFVLPLSQQQEEKEQQAEAEVVPSSSSD